MPPEKQNRGLTSGEKAEKIIDQIRRSINGDFEPGSQSRKEEPILKISAEQKAEALWALWLEYRRRLSDYLKKQRKLQEPEREVIEGEEGRREPLKRPKLKELLENFDKDPKIAKIRSLIAQYWEDPKVQSLFRHHLEMELQERETINPSLEIYMKKRKNLQDLTAERLELLKELFAERDRPPEPSDRIELAMISVQIETLEAEMEAILQSDPELAARVQFEKLRDYHFDFGGEFRLFQQMR